MEQSVGELPVELSKQLLDLSADLLLLILARVGVRACAFAACTCTRLRSLQLELASRHVWAARAAL